MNKKRDKDSKPGNNFLAAISYFIITLLLNSLFIIIDNKDPTPTRFSRPEKKPDPVRGQVYRKLESFFIYLFFKKFFTSDNSLNSATHSNISPLLVTGLTT